MEEEYSGELLQKLVHPSPVIRVDIGSVRVDGMIDTGCNVSTIRKSFFQSNFPNMGIHDCSHLITVKAANSTELSVLGYVMLRIKIDGVPIPNEVGFLIIENGGTS